MPLMISRARIDVVEKYLVSGCFEDEAAEAAGIATRTLKLWMQKGQVARQKEDGGEALGEDEALYRDLWNVVRKARGEAKINAHAQIRKAMGTNWRAAAWYLERVDPQRYVIYRHREGEVPTADQVAGMVVESGEIGESDRDGLVVAIRDHIERKRRENGGVPASPNGRHSNGNGQASDGEG